MREILFRAKRIDNGEWVEGDLRQDRDLETAYISGWDYYTTEGGLEREPFECEIKLETLCQFTGLKDKNGNRIWENDIVRCNRREKEAKYKVVWDKTYADFRIEKLNGLGVMPICIEEGNVPVFGRHYERIGNIFDNPELLKGE